MEWSDDIIGQLRALWDEGHSTAEIGRRLGVTKNAIVGKAHRLDLPARPSPIRRDPDAAPVRRAPVRRVEGPTLPPLPSAVADADGGMPVYRNAAACSAAGFWRGSDAGQHHANAAAAFGHDQTHRHDAFRAAAGGAGTACIGRSAAEAGSVRTQTLWPSGHLLLADRRARHQRVPLLRRAVRAGPPVLRGTCEDRLRKGPRPPRGRRLKVAAAGVTPAPGFTSAPRLRVGFGRHRAKTVEPFDSRQPRA